MALWITDDTVMFMYVVTTLRLSIFETLWITDDTVMLCYVSSNNFKSVHIRGSVDYRMKKLCYVM